MAGGSYIKVEGLPQLSRAIAKANTELDRFMRDGLYEIGELVATDVRGEYGLYSAVGAAGVQTKVRKSGYVVVAQTLRKSRELRRRPNFGPLMMSRAFLPALRDNEEAAQGATDALFQQIRREWDSG